MKKAGSNQKRSREAALTFVLKMGAETERNLARVKNLMRQGIRLLLFCLQDQFQSTDSQNSIPTRAHGGSNTLIFWMIGQPLSWAPGKYPVLIKNSPVISLPVNKNVCLNNLTQSGFIKGWCDSNQALKPPPESRNA